MSSNLITILIGITFQEYVPQSSPRFNVNRFAGYLMQLRCARQKDYRLVQQTRPLRNLADEPSQMVSCYGRLRAFQVC